MKTIDEFTRSLDQASPPAGLSLALQALWHERKGDWGRAHACAQACEATPDEPDGAWVHAYLHRVEGDLANAGYWYRRAGKAVCASPLQQEWEAIAVSLLR